LEVFSFSASQRKAKKIKTQRSLRLRGEDIIARAGVLPAAGEKPS
jgi:hypothetical protein